MSFPTLNTLADNMVSLLDGLNHFKEIRKCSCTSYEDVIEEIGELSETPAAIVCVGSEEYEADGLLKKVTAAIVLIMEYESNSEEEVLSTLQTVDLAAGLFEVTAHPRDIRRVGRNEFRIKTMSPLLLSGCDYAAYQLEIEITVPAKF